MKLKSWGLIQEDIDLLIIELIQFNFLNEKRYARSFARGKFRIKKWEKLKIRMALKKRDIYFKCIDFACSIKSFVDFVLLIDLFITPHLGHP